MTAGNSWILNALHNSLQSPGSVNVGTAVLSPGVLTECCWAAIVVVFLILAQGTPGMEPEVSVGRLNLQHKL